MKKIVKMFMVFVVVFTLTACQDDKVLSNAYQELSIDADLSNVTEDLDLITQIGEVTIEWKSSNEGVITPEGVVRLRDGKRIVSLTATLSYKGKIMIKAFDITVPSKPKDPIVDPVDPVDPVGNEQILKDYKKWLNEHLSFTYVTHDVDLPKTHPVLGGVVQWATTNGNIISSDGKVKRGQADQEVTLSAKITHGNNSLDVDFDFIVLNNAVNNSLETISAIRAKSLGTSVTALGVVTEVIGNNAYIQDTTGAIYLYLGKDTSYVDELEEGNLIQVSGILAQFNGLTQISTITSVKVIKTAVQQPKIVELQNFSNSSLKDLESAKVAVKDATITKLPLVVQGGVDNFIELSYGNEKIQIFISKHLESSIIEGLNNKLKWFKVGDLISLNGIVVGNYNGYQFVLSGSENIVDKPLTTAQKLEAVNDSLKDILSLDGTSIYRKVDFIKSSVYDSKITYVSTHPQILNVGVFEPQDVDTVVTIKFIIEIDGQTFPEQEIMVTVKAKGQTVDPIENLSAYYKAAEGLSGAALRSQLNKIISSNVRSISYSDTSYILDETDVDPNNAKNVLLIYNRASVSGVWNGTTWNKEHVWPQSKLGSASKSDLHNLRPANPTINSNRGNLAFADGKGSFGKVSGGWFPGEEDKGDVARIVLYMNVRWNLEITKGGIGELKTFLKWHLEDPVDDFERNRNNVIFENQKNRNPFIDYPEFVELIWGSFTQSLSLEFGIYNSSIFVNSNLTNILHVYENNKIQLLLDEYTIKSTYVLLKSKEQYM